jgi:hypothetical protein
VTLHDVHIPIFASCIFKGSAIRRWNRREKKSWAITRKPTWPLVQ